MAKEAVVQGIPPGTQLAAGNPTPFHEVDRLLRTLPAGLSISKVSDFLLCYQTGLCRETERSRSVVMAYEGVHRSSGYSVYVLVQL